MYERRSRRATWFWFALIVIGSVLMWAVLLSNGEKRSSMSPEESMDLRGYFPAFRGFVYDFDGEGMEFASFTRSVKFVEDDYVQVHDANGTVVARVFHCSPHEIRLVRMESEFYEDVNLIDSVSEERQEPAVILQSPLVVGSVWEERPARYREITAVDQVITVPAGTFYDVIEVRITSKESDPNTYTYEYYAKNIGLIKRVFISEIDGGEYVVSSYLKHLTSLDLQP